MRHLLHVNYPLDLRCYLLQFVCNPFEVEGEGDLIGEVVAERVGEVVVEKVREVVVCQAPHPCLGGLRGANPNWDSLLVFFQTLVHPLLIIELKYDIHRYKNKTTTIVVFTVQCIQS